jgi:DnaA family protein
MRQLPLDLTRPLEPTLDNFVAGNNGELLAALHLAAAGRTGERFIYLWGHPGCGRTHLLKGFVAASAEAGQTAHYIEAGGFPSLAGLADTQAVAVDDVEALSGDNQIALFNLYNELRANGGLLAVAGPAAPAALGLRPDLVTRLGWGLVFQVRELTDDEKREALQKHAQDKGLRVSDEVLSYLLTHWQRDLPALVAALEAIDRHSLSTKRPVTLPLLKAALERG